MGARSQEFVIKFVLVRGMVPPMLVRDRLASVGAKTTYERFMQPNSRLRLRELVRAFTPSENADRRAPHSGG